MATGLLCKILPDLEATPSRMMACVEALVTRGGEDLLASEPNGAFRVWCAEDLRRAREVIATARAGDDLASRHLTFALEALKAIPEARQIALAYDDDRRLSALTALGRMEDDNPASREESFATLNTLLDSGADDQLRANMLNTTAAILARDPDAHLHEAGTLMKRLFEGAGEITLHASARILWAYRKAMKPEIAASLLEALAHLKPTNKGTVRKLDLGLKSLLDCGQDEAAIHYVTELLSRQDNALELEELGSFTRALLAGPPERISRVVVRWLLLGAPDLCDGLVKAIQGADMNGPPLDLRGEDLAISPSAQVFLCRKAIGWFFLKPITAASVLVSVLRVCDAETAVEVQKLLVEILLLNFLECSQLSQRAVSRRPCKGPR